jgi:antibiotic biosynthesis monooxygenase (ABM) superfamily enzyme
MSAAHDHAIAVVVTRRVRPADAPAFEALLHELIGIAERQPGHISGDVLRGPAGAYHVLYRFEDEASLRRWEAVPERRALVAQIERLTTDGGRRELTGLEAWFDLPPGRPAPSRHRMALLTWLAIWPLVSLALKLLAPRLAGLPFLARTGLVTALVVATMTYVVMPPLARLAAPYLSSRP